MCDTAIGGVGVICVMKRAPLLNARSSGRTSLTKIRLFFWLSMCPVTANPGRRKRDKGNDKQRELDGQRDHTKDREDTAGPESVHLWGRLTEVRGVARPPHVQSKHMNWDHLQLIVDLQGDINTRSTKNRP